MWQFVKFSLATVVGIFLFLLFGLLITVGIGSAMSGDTEYEVKENSILKSFGNFCEAEKDQKIKFRLYQ